MSFQVDDSVKLSINAILEKKGENTVLLDIKGLTSIADLFIICSADTERQVKAIADHVIYKLKKQGTKAIGMDGADLARWIILDYGDFIVHVFKKDIREIYSLEEFWSKAGFYWVEESGKQDEEISFELVPDEGKDVKPV